MFTNYIKTILEKAIYETDENDIVIVKIPGMAGYYTQGDSFEEARANMIDLIETMIIDDIKSRVDIPMLSKRKFSGKKELQYA